MSDIFCMELARMLSFSDVYRILKHTSDVQLPGDISSSKPIESDVSEEDRTAGESNNSQFTRLPRVPEISLSGANGSLLKTLRDYASQPEEFYSRLCKEQWLRTVVNCESKDALLQCSGDISKSDFSQFTIQCNVVPCEPYWEKLQRARSSVDDRAGASSKGVYFPSSSLGNHAFQLTRDYQQECNILSGWIKRFDYEMIDRTDMIPRRLRREIKPSNGDLKRSSSPRYTATNSGKFRKAFWKGGLFGVKVFKKNQEKIFLAEVKVLEAIGTHPHIVHSFGVSKPEGDDGYKYWMENLDRNLLELIIDSVRDGLLEDHGPFSINDSMDILLQIAKAMTRLHELNVIHGDLTPNNILISHYEVSGDVKLYIVKVADFDRAKIIKSDEEVVFITGTDEYIAPEVFDKGRGRGLTGSNAKKCDVYSFGIVAVEVLTGELSEGKQQDFQHDRRDDVMKPLETIRISQEYPDLIDLVARCLNHDYSLRPSFAEVTTKLECISLDVSN